MRYILLTLLLTLSGCAYNETTIYATDSYVRCYSTTEKPVSVEGLNGNTVPVSALP